MMKFVVVAACVSFALTCTLVLVSSRGGHAVTKLSKICDASGDPSSNLGDGDIVCMSRTCKEFSCDNVGYGVTFGCVLQV